MCCGRRNWPGCSQSSAFTRRWGAVGSQRWRYRSMLFKPELNETGKVAGKGVTRVASRSRRRTVSIAITLLVLGGLGYIGWTSVQQKQQEGAGRRQRPDARAP